MLKLSVSCWWRMKIKGLSSQFSIYRFLQLQWTVRYKLIRSSSSWIELYFSLGNTFSLISSSIRFAFYFSRLMFEAPSFYNPWIHLFVPLFHLVCSWGCRAKFKYIYFVFETVTVSSWPFLNSFLHLQQWPNRELHYAVIRKISEKSCGSR